MFLTLAIHVITRVFNTFTLIYLKIMPTWASPLNQLIAIIAFDSQFKSSSISLSFPIVHLKKYIKFTLQPSNWRGQPCFTQGKVILFHRISFCRPNNSWFGLMLFKSMLMQCDRQKSVIIFAASGKFSENGCRY